MRNKKPHIFTGIILVALLCMTSMAFADGKFFGTVTYKYCTCTYGAYADMVNIWQAGIPGDQYGVACNPSPGYDTGTRTYPPGWYYLSVSSPYGQGGCKGGPIIYIYHGTQDQRVNLTIQGDTPTPDGPGGE